MNAAKKRTRQDRHDALVPHLTEDENALYIEHNLSLSKYQKVDIRNAEEVRQRVDEYFRLCQLHNRKPHASGLAVCMGIDRRTLTLIKDGSDRVKNVPPDVRETLQRAYMILEAQLIDYMSDNKQNVVGAIFLAKNNYGFRDQTETVTVIQSEQGEGMNVDEIRRRYLED